MELRLVGEVPYHNAFGSLYEGGTTERLEWPEEVKVKMLEDFPELFEAFEGAPVEEETDGKKKKK